MTTIDLLNQWLEADAEVKRCRGVFIPASNALTAARKVEAPLAESLAPILFGPLPENHQEQSKTVSIGGRILRLTRHHSMGFQIELAEPVESVEPSVLGCCLKPFVLAVRQEDIESARRSIERDYALANETTGTK